MPGGKLSALTSRVSYPPTMLRPRPTFPLQISMTVSPPATTGQLRGSEVAVADPSQSERPVGEEEEVDEAARVREEAGEGERG